MTLFGLGTVGIALFGYAVLSRLTYVLFVGNALRREEREQAYTRRFGVEVGFRRFRRTAALIMNNDAVALVLLCIATRGTLVLPIARPLTIAIGVLLTVVGLGTKLWAARTLGGKAYYWHNFFAPSAATPRVSSGPYRFVSNPMYTIGYLQTYGIALIAGSWPGLVASVFAHIAILIFHLVVEKPHFERLHGSS